MEFPDLGKHCNETNCHRLDFLPLKCDSCNKVYCCTHFQYEQHACQGHRKDKQVPICPLCEKPVPTPPGVEPDVTVGRHIDEQCKSGKKIFTNRCTYNGCKRKELIPVTCTECGRNFCLRHRHTADHQCKGKLAGTLNPKKLETNAVENRRHIKPAPSIEPNSRLSENTDQSRVSTSQVHKIQGNMTEDEALARALALSIYELDESADRSRRNATTDQRNSTLRAGGTDGHQQTLKDKCSIS